MFEKTWIEKSYNNDLIITPIDKAYQFSNNKGNNVSNYFVCVLDSTSKIVTSFIVQNRPTNSFTTNIKKGAIANIYDYKPLEVDCNVTFINIYDYYLYEMNFKNNNIVSIRNLNKKSSSHNTSLLQSNSSSTSDCIDWYWVTTYSDGSQTWEYVATTCGNCGMSNPHNASVDCLDNPGGGSGGGAVADDGKTVTRDVTFVVKEISTGSQERWQISGTFKISGVSFINTANNYFTSISYVGDVCIDYNPAYTGLPSNLAYYIYTATHSSGLIGTITAKGTINAQLYYPNWLRQYGYERRDLWTNSSFWDASTHLY